MTTNFIFISILTLQNWQSNGPTSTPPMLSIWHNCDVDDMGDDANKYPPLLLALPPPPLTRSRNFSGARAAT